MQPRKRHSGYFCNVCGEEFWVGDNVMQGHNVFKELIPGHYVHPACIPEERKLLETIREEILAAGYVIDGAA